MVIPESKDTLNPTLIEDTFNSVTNEPFFTPLSRSLVDEKFNVYTLNEIGLRLANCKNVDLDEKQFLNTS